MSESLTDHDILCLSHLRWERTLFQRPQQLMSQFDAMGIRVRYISQWSTREYVKALWGGRRGELRGRAGLHLEWRTLPFLPGVQRSGFMEKLNIRFYGAGARRMAARGKNGSLLLWVYHPWFLPVVDLISHNILVYDCMDPFVAFRAERNKERVDEQERELIRRAGVVFTGGRSLQAAKEGINPRTYCFPSGIDLPHFTKALDKGVALPSDVAGLPRPVLGFWGAVDERIDFALLEAVCRRRPDASVVLLGPRVGMEELPIEAPNFHYLGRKEYGELPAYLRAFDLCLLPFVVSPLTTSMSPTKTPEYLAGGRPVVSTAIPDVARKWGDVVAVAEDAGAFVDAIERELERPRPDPRLVEAARERAATWEQITASMREQIEAVIREIREDAL